MRVKITKERSDLCDLVSAAIKATYNTRSLGGVKRCIDVLHDLKSLSLSVKDIRLSESIVKLEILRRHRNPKIRKEAQALFHSWLKTIYTHGRDNTFKAALTKARKKHVLTRFSELKKNKEGRSVALEETRETEKIKNEAKIDLKPNNLKRRRVGLEDATTKKPRGAATYVLSSGLGSLTRKTDMEVAGNQKMCSVTPNALDHHSRQNIKETDRQVTTKTLIPPPRRRIYKTEQHQSQKDSTNPKSATLKTKTEKELRNKKAEEMVEQFEAAKKAADMANAKGILLGKQEASRCVDALSLLMGMNITPEATEAGRMMARLEGLTKYKDRKICHAASALLQLWRQRIREQEGIETATKTFPNNYCNL